MKKTAILITLALALGSITAPAQAAKHGKSGTTKPAPKAPKHKKG